MLQPIVKINTAINSESTCRSALTVDEVFFEVACALGGPLVGAVVGAPRSKEDMEYVVVVEACDAG